MGEWKEVQNQSELKKLPDGTRVRYQSGVTICGGGSEKRYLLHKGKTVDTVTGQKDSQNNYVRGWTDIKVSFFDKVEYHTTDKITILTRLEPVPKDVVVKPLKVKRVKDKRSKFEKSICEMILG